MGSIKICLFVLFLLFAGQVLLVTTTAEIGMWGKLSERDQGTTNQLLFVNGLGLLTILLSALRALFCFYFCIAASKALHDRMVEKVLRAPISFFDVRPVGLILNRFSADTGSNDDPLPGTLCE